MKHIHYHNNRRKGLCLIEVLLSLSIMALLLGATAVAFDAALGNYKVNHDLASVSVSARNALYQMCTIVRSAYNDPTDPSHDTIDVTSDGNHCSLNDQWERDVEYLYDPVNHQLKVTVDGGSNWYVMVNDVYPITVGEPIFVATEPQALGFTAGTVGKVEIRFMVSREGLSRTFSQAVVPRNVLYSL